MSQTVRRDRMSESARRRRHNGTLPPGRHKLPREVVEGSQRDRLRQAVLVAAWRRGLSRLRVQDVIAPAHISRKTVYELYANVDELFADAHLAEMQAAREQAAEGITVREQVEGFLAYWDERRAPAGACLVEIAGAAPQLRTVHDHELLRLPFVAGLSDLHAHMLLGALAKLVACELRYGNGSLLELTDELAHLARSLRRR